MIRISTRKRGPNKINHVSLEALTLLKYFIGLGHNSSLIISATCVIAISQRIILGGRITIPNS
jgi:hypothetical protein